MNVTVLGKKRFAGWGVEVMVVPVHVMVIELVHRALSSDGVQMEDPSSSREGLEKRSLPLYGSGRELRRVQVEKSA